MKTSAGVRKEFGGRQERNMNMATTYVFFNPLAGNGKCGDSAKGLTKVVGEGAVFCNMTDESVYESTLFSLAPDDKLIVCGGDGTLNRFINFIATATSDTMFSTVRSARATTLRTTSAKLRTTNRSTSPNILKICLRSA